MSTSALHPEVDVDALLCALVLAPRTFARNRFFSLYLWSPAKRVRSRAAELRAIVRHLAGRGRVRADLVGLEPQHGCAVVLRYRLAHLSLERTAVLDALELGLVRFALDRVMGTRAHEGGQRQLAADLMVTDRDRALVERAVSKLGQRLDLGLHPVDPAPDRGSAVAGES